MKKLIAMALVLCMALVLVACGKDEAKDTKPATDPIITEPSTAPATEPSTEPSESTPAAPTEVMTYEQYAAAAEYDPLLIEAYVQATQSWWDDKISVYAQDENGAYFIYNMACSEEDAMKLVPGAKIRVTGYKAVFNGLNEIAEGATFEFVEAEPFIAESLDVTALMGTDELVKHQGEKVSFKGATVVAKTNAAGEEAAFVYNWDGSGEAGGDCDLYFDATINGQTYTFVIEYYLCNESSEAYQAVQNLKVGDVIDMEGFLYWYEGPQAHITAVTVK